MKQFLETKLFPALGNTSKRSISARVLADAYDEFALFLLSESSLPQNRAVLYGRLCYARVEFGSLAEVLKKKRNSYPVL
jgi:hypothetical protein